MLKDHPCIRTMATLLAFSAGIVVMISGCGGAGTSDSTSAIPITSQLGPISFVSTGGAQQPVFANGSGSTATGIAGTLISGFTYTPGTKNLVKLAVEGPSGIFLMPFSGGPFLPVTSGHNPTWTPDGYYLIYSKLDANQVSQIFSLDVSSSRNTPLQLTNGANSKTNPVQNNLGDLFYIAQSQTQVPQIFDKFGATTLQVTSLPTGVTSFGLSPDGRQIAFISRTSTGAQLFVCDRSGGSANQITFDGSIKLSPSWSPDGKSIAYASQNSICVIPYWGGNSTTVADGTSLGIGTFSPTWSPDGHTIAFVEVSASEKMQIYSVPAAGGTPSGIGGFLAGASPSCSCSPYLLSDPIKLLGTGSAYLGNAAGVIFTQSGQAMDSFIAFDTNKTTAASKA